MHFMTGVRDYMGEKADYLQTQIGNPDGEKCQTKNITIQEYGYVKEK